MNPHKSGGGFMEENKPLFPIKPPFHVLCVLTKAWAMTEHVSYPTQWDFHPLRDFVLKCAIWAKCRAVLMCFCYHCAHQFLKKILQLYIK